MAAALLRLSSRTCSVNRAPASYHVNHLFHGFVKRFFHLRRCTEPQYPLATLNDTRKYITSVPFHWRIDYRFVRCFTKSSSTDADPRPISDIFDKWCKEYGRTYASEQEKEKRLKIFEKTYEYIQEHNKTNSSYTVGLNSFSDISDEEFRRRFEMDDPVDCSCDVCRSAAARGVADEEAARGVVDEDGAKSMEKHKLPSKKKSIDLKFSGKPMNMLPSTTKLILLTQSASMSSLISPKKNLRFLDSENEEEEDNLVKESEIPSSVDWKKDGAATE